MSSNTGSHIDQFVQGHKVVVIGQAIHTLNNGAGFNSRMLMNQLPYFPYGKCGKRYHSQMREGA